MLAHTFARAATLHFHFINPNTGHRVRTVTLDADDFARARIETSSVEKFVPRDAIQPIWFDTSYYMVPDGDAVQDVYVVLRDAIAQSGQDLGDDYEACLRTVIDARLKREGVAQEEPATSRTRRNRRRGVP